MRIERLTIAEGDTLALRLLDSRQLEGSYFLVPRPEAPERFFITPADGDRGEFTGITGLDPDRGWVTLLRNTSQAIVMLGVTQSPLV